MLTYTEGGEPMRLATVCQPPRPYSLSRIHHERNPRSNGLLILGRLLYKNILPGDWSTVLGAFLLFPFDMFVA